MIKLRLLSFNTSFSLFVSYFLNTNQIVFSKNNSTFIITVNSLKKYYLLLSFFSICKISTYKNFIYDSTFFQEDEAFFLEEVKPFTKKKRGWKHTLQEKKFPLNSFFLQIQNQQNFFCLESYMQSLQMNLTLPSFFFYYSIYQKINLYLWIYKVFFFKIINDHNTSSRKA